MFNLALKQHWKKGEASPAGPPAGPLAVPCRAPNSKAKRHAPDDGIPKPHPAAIDPPFLGPKTVSFTVHPLEIQPNDNPLLGIIACIHVGRQCTELEPKITGFKPNITCMQVGNTWLYLQYGQAGHFQWAKIPSELHHLHNSSHHTDQANTSPSLSSQCSNS